MISDKKSQLLALNHPYFEPIELPFELPTKFYGAMLVVWQLKPNLQRRFPLYRMRRRDYLNFLAWCVTIGRRECSILCEIEAWDEELYQPVKFPKLAFDKWHGCINVALYLIGLHKARYWQWQNRYSVGLRNRTCRWFFRSGKALLKLESLKEWQLAALKNQFSSIDGFERALLKRGESTSLKFDLDEIRARWAERKNLLDQKLAIGLNRFVMSLICLLVPVWLNVIVAWWNRLRAIKRQVASFSQHQLLEQIPVRKQNYSFFIDDAERLPFGVNLYGYAKGELGIGEDVRMMALSMEASSIPFCVINVELPDSVSQKDSSISHWIVAEPKYSINLFCMTGLEMCRLVAEQGVSKLLGKHNIGLWPWELPKWPTPLHHIWNLVDEIWGISQFVSEAYSEAPVPVNTIPLPVELGAVSDLSREDLNLPENAYLFVFSFDINSTITRKNPIGTIIAFKKAFPSALVSEVGLVLKISHLNDRSEQWKEIKSAIGNDDRIHVIAKEMRRPDVLGLYKCCNCYVSLHRSEGFGRALAEAKLLNIGLIATRFSGNLDFCYDGSTLLVDNSRLSLTSGEYFFGDGQYWAEPDTDHASAAMVRMYSDFKAKKSISIDLFSFSTGHCGALFKQRLGSIVGNFNQKENRNVS